MFQVVLFNKEGLYCGFKQYDIKPEKIPSDEYIVTDEQWSNKESLIVQENIVIFSQEQDRFFNIDNLKNNIRTFIESKARSLGFDSSLDLISYIHDHDNKPLQNQAKAFIKWRSYIWKCFHSYEIKNKNIPDIHCFLKDNKISEEFI